MTTVLRATQLCKTFFSPMPVAVLKGVNLEIRKREKIAIMGKSGEGKSTLLHILGTLEQPSEGEVEFPEVKEISSFAALRNRYIGFIFQAFNLLEDYTVLENLLMPLEIGRKVTKKNTPSYLRALSLLERVGLENRKDFPAKLLSGGEKQRVAIARALMNDPHILLADEPSGNLDSTTSKSIHALLVECASEQNKALVVVTHDQELAALCDRTLILKNGVLCTS